jgi:hypothetical protein
MRHFRSMRHRTVSVLGAAFLVASGILILVTQPAGATTLTSGDGYTSLSTEGTVTPGTPYTSGQTITITVESNSVLNNANLVANGVPGQTPGNPTGFYYIEECSDPDGLVANLPTTPNGCEHSTLDLSQAKSKDGSLDDTSLVVYDLPDENSLGAPNMVGECDVAPNECVIGVFATSPQSGDGFGFPHLFSAPFQITVGNGLDEGDNPGDGTPETPYAVALPVIAVGAFGVTAVVRRRRTSSQ